MKCFLWAIGIVFAIYTGIILFGTIAGYIVRRGRQRDEIKWQQEEIKVRERTKWWTNP
jgi:hypothetical protein